ncbi:MAG TPA: LuxR C-terminal-related transcriptional regulator [Burkholderiales bacterium]|nr:LuxR C-terminal-related transcriptional regulator [Burkholderiales bacterium]
MSASTDPTDPQTLQLLLGLYQAIDAEAVWRAGVRLLRHVVPGFHYLMGLPSVGTMPVFIRTTLQIEGDRDVYLARIHAAAPIEAAMHMFPDRRVIRLSDQFPGDSVEQTALYREFMAPEGWRYSFLMPLRDEQGGYVGLFSAIRTTAQGDYTDAEVEVLAALQPHFERAALRVLRIDEERAARRSLEKSLHRSSLPLASFDTRLRPLYSNRAWARACRDWSGGAGTLPADIAAAVEVLIAQWHQVVLTGEPPRSTAPRTVKHADLPGWQADLQLIVSPGDRLASHPTLVVRIHEPAAKAVRDAASIERILQRLSEAERRVARVAGRGFDNGAIAAALHVSVNTVRTHLRNIYRKLDISNRSQLVALLAPAEAVAEEARDGA